MSRSPYPYRVLGADLVHVAGAFDKIAGPAVDAAVGFGVTVASAGSGVYTLTLDHKYPYCLSSVVQISGVASAAQTAITATAAYSASTGVLTITFRDAAGAPVEPTNGTTISYHLTLQSRNVLGTS